MLVSVYFLINDKISCAGKKRIGNQLFDGTSIGVKMITTRIFGKKVTGKTMYQCLVKAVRFFS